MSRMSTSLAFMALLLPTIAAPEDAGVRHVEAAGARFPYVESGRGDTALFVHGAFADHRAWEAMREKVAEDFRFIAYTQRGFGTGTWPDQPAFARDVHEADLAALLDAWAEPMHLVGWSYSGPIVLQAALDRPDLVRRIVIFEPTLETVLEGMPEHEKALKAWGQGWGPAVAASQAGDDRKAVTLAIEYVFGLPPGGFDTLPEPARAIFFDNAPTVPKLFGAPAATPMTCDDLGRIQAPVLILWGTETLPFFQAAATEVAACLPNAKLEEIPGAGHGAPLQNRDEFLGKTLSFLREADGS
ncbi:alpha/beta fold hydrolase [Paracoccus benzoatiresistens]|uniref:Alpha/beta hydrolase n=1 Tax=Paracoccus benzoatiresistens TaxID=2997341 RepID=A0ABT4J682_9RHOB|nr:alpha/beta hydrolase [Paracoccus sp. EF6]MCZ0962629.1 alpha/beta hydrolase [Paracoccus sp. EF6]